MSTLGKRVMVKAIREFESLQLRHFLLNSAGLRIPPERPIEDLGDLCFYTPSSLMGKYLLTGLILVLSFGLQAKEPECFDPTTPLSEDMNKLVDAFSPDPLRFTLSEEGNFLLKLNIDFPLELDPVEVLKRFTDPETVVGNSSIIKGLSYLKGSKILDPETCAEPEVVTSKSCKSIACVETKSLCSYTTLTPTHAEYRCKVDTTHESTKNLFYWGSSKYSCRKTKLSTSCTFVMEGKPKPLDKFFMKRSSRQLALGGAVETALGHLKIALPLALDKALIYKTLQRTKYDFYQNGKDLIERESSKPITINYK